jgi:hypothetical protein
MVEFKYPRLGCRHICDDEDPESAIRILETVKVSLLQEITDINEQIQLIKKEFL